MKFKVINERTKEVIGSELDIHGARVLKRKYNTTEKVDYFYIKEEKEFDLDSLKYLINKHPNDASLGAEVRKLCR